MRFGKDIHTLKVEHVAVTSPCYLVALPQQFFPSSPDIQTNCLFWNLQIQDMGPCIRLSLGRMLLRFRHVVYVWMSTGFFFFTYFWLLPIIAWVGRIPWRRKWHPTPVFLPGKSHGGRNLVGYSPWGRKEPDTTERLHFHFSLSLQIKSL